MIMQNFPILANIILIIYALFMHYSFEFDYMHKMYF